MSRLTIFVATLIVALAAFPVQAQETFDAGSYCNAIASYSEDVANARDRGVPLLNILDSASAIQDDRARSDVLTVIALAHTKPYGTPAQEASIAFQICWETYGE